MRTALGGVCGVMLAACGAYDNTGGSPPAGTAVEFMVRTNAPECGQFRNQRFLLTLPASSTRPSGSVTPRWSLLRRLRRGRG